MIIRSSRHPSNRFLLSALSALSALSVLIFLTTYTPSPTINASGSIYDSEIAGEPGKVIEEADSLKEKLKDFVVKVIEEMLQPEKNGLQPAH